MRLVWTRSTRLSDEHDIITWAFGHRCSHFAIGFFDEAVLFHSQADGVGVDDYYKFYANRMKVYEIEIPTSYEEEAEILQAMIDLYADLPYDYRFFTWLFWVAFKRKVLGIKPPLFIEQQDAGAIICHEVLNLLPEDIRPDIDLRRSVMPETMYLLVQDATEGMYD